MRWERKTIKKRKNTVTNNNARSIIAHIFENAPIVKYPIESSNRSMTEDDLSVVDLRCARA